jgi:hypothetical protein
VLVAGFAAVLSAAVRLEQRKPWAPVGPRLGKTFGIAVDIQTLMGASLYLILSPLTTIGVRSTTAPLQRVSDAYYFAGVHPLIMLAAFIGVHVASILIRRARSDAAHQWRAVVFYGTTLLILLSGIPWWRPWLRF